MASDFALEPAEAFQGTASAYYEDAEKCMQRQWDAMIWPVIRDFDFSVTLDFACGHGRNTVLLARHAKRIYAVDANPRAVEVAARRLVDFDRKGCSIEVILNNGRDLHAIPSGAVTTLYSFDSVVHFERRLVEIYMPEFARVMRPGGRAFIHHSNFGRISDNPDFKAHLGWRSNVDKDWFARCCWSYNLWPVRQILLDWWVGQCTFHEFDCLTVMYKPL
jgi:SAM-dependent methyltransferase